MKTSKWGTCNVKFDEKSGELFIYKGELDKNFCPNLVKEDVKKIIFEEKVFAPEDSYSLFKNFIELTEFVNIENLDTNKVTDMCGMFYNCSNLKSLNLSNFNTDNVTNMFCMFYNCSNLKSLNLSNFNTDKVTDMYGMFYNCSNLKSLNLSNFNTDKVTNMFCMFYNCKSLKSLILSNFNTDNVTNMEAMFYNCSILKEIENYGFTKHQQIVIDLIEDENKKLLKQLEFINN